jgi:hypothetical protein
VRRVIGLVLVWSVTTAYADDALTTSLVERYGTDDHAEPGLTLDPMFRPGIETVGMKEVHHETRYDLFGTQIVVNGVERASERDSFTRGYRAGITISRDLGFARLSAGIALDHLQSSNMLVGPYDPTAANPERAQRFGSATFIESGVALTRTHRFSRWMTGWISLSLTQRTYLGDATPPGERSSTQLMLSVGTTFK